MKRIGPGLCPGPPSFRPSIQIAALPVVGSSDAAGCQTGRTRGAQLTCLVLPATWKPYATVRGEATPKQCVGPG